MTRRWMWAGLATAIGMAALAGTPRPCAACTLAAPPAERLTLELVSVTVDGVAADAGAYDGYDTHLDPLPDGSGMQLTFREGERRVSGVFR